MGDAWKKASWGDLATLEYGKSLRDYAGNIKLYRVYGTNGKIGTHDAALSPGPTVVVGRKGAYRGVHYSDAPCYVIDTAFYLSPRVPLDMRWAYYALLTQDINAMDSGSAIPSTSRGDFYRLNVSVPPITEQRAIASILGALDDKIELNRGMSATLEAMARVLFTSWFVDFDPVRAKVEGRETDLAPEIASLFPDRFAPNGVPVGWQKTSVYDVAEVLYGAPFASRFFNEDHRGKPLIRIRDLAAQSPNVYTTEEHPRGYLTQPGDLLVGMDGEFRPYMWMGPMGWMNQRVCCFKPRNGASRAFVHFAIEKLLLDVEQSEAATTVIHLGKSDIDLFQVLRPCDGVMKAYGAVADHLERRALAASQESQVLIDLRDALLPKLISGDVRILVRD